MWYNDVHLQFRDDLVGFVSQNRGFWENPRRRRAVSRPEGQRDREGTLPKRVFAQPSFPCRVRQLASFPQSQLQKTNPACIELGSFGNSPPFGNLPLEKATPSCPRSQSIPVGPFPLQPRTVYADRPSVEFTPTPRSGRPGCHRCSVGKRSPTTRAESLPTAQSQPIASHLSLVTSYQRTINDPSYLTTDITPRYPSQPRNRLSTQRHATRRAPTLARRWWGHVAPRLTSAATLYKLFTGIVLRDTRSMSSWFKVRMTLMTGTIS